VSYIVIRKIELHGRTAVAAYSTSLEEAAKLTELAADHVEWAIENYGRCDVEGWVIIPAKPFSR
jgi:hypothetical protein